MKLGPVAQEDMSFKEKVHTQTQLEPSAQVLFDFV